MSELSFVAMVTGTVLVLAGLGMLALPGVALRGLRAFPRSAWPAWVLTAAALSWATYLLFKTPPWEFQPLIVWLCSHVPLLQPLLQPLLPVQDFKPMLWVLSPVFFLLIVFFVDELLATRALGGLLLLAGAPILDAARWHPSAWRFVMTVFAYVLVVAGMVLVVSPFRFRTTVDSWIKGVPSCRIAGAVFTTFGFVVVALGLTIY